MTPSQRGRVSNCPTMTIGHIGQGWRGVNDHIIYNIYTAIWPGERRCLWPKRKDIGAVCLGFVHGRLARDCPLQDWEDEQVRCAWIIFETKHVCPLFLFMAFKGNQTISFQMRKLSTMLWQNKLCSHSFGMTPACELLKKPWSGKNTRWFVHICSHLNMFYRSVVLEECHECVYCISQAFGWHHHGEAAEPQGGRTVRVSTHLTYNQTSKVHSFPKSCDDCSGQAFSRLDPVQLAERLEPLDSESCLNAHGVHIELIVHFW